MIVTTCDVCGSEIECQAKGHDRLSYNMSADRKMQWPSEDLPPDHPDYYIIGVNIINAHLCPACLVKVILWHFGNDHHEQN